jgi:hypothetical protein
MKHTTQLFLLLFSIFFFCPTNLLAQQEPVGIYIYDVIYMNDGRILKGEILVFEERDGDITFRDLEGRKYSITRKEYRYFVEDQRYYVNESDTLYIKERKSEEWEISLGFSGAFINLKQNLKATDYIRSTGDSYAQMPLSLAFGVGKYINRQNFVGMRAEMGVISEARNFINFGFRYFHQYDAYKKNISFYIPVEVYFNSMVHTSDYTYMDTNFYPPNTYVPYPNTMNVEVSIQSIGLSLGQGVSFMLNNKKSVSVELSLFKFFVLRQKYLDLEGEQPRGAFDINGFRLSLLYNI